MLLRRVHRKCTVFAEPVKLAARVEDDLGNGGYVESNRWVPLAGLGPELAGQLNLSNDETDSLRSQHRIAGRPADLRCKGVHN